ncbi:hypothetical protein EDB19DRAFT_1904597 [Suillus lakei]|nr:hypothetical protein EDB19DRAFT_1904597 [Suillus lakei]
MNLDEAFCNKVGLVSLDFAVGPMFNLIDPLQVYNLILSSSCIASYHRSASGQFMASLKVLDSSLQAVVALYIFFLFSLWESCLLIGIDKIVGVIILDRCLVHFIALLVVQLGMDMVQVVQGLDLALDKLQELAFEGVLNAL